MSDGSNSLSFNILDISDIIQLHTAFGLLDILVASSNKFDKYLDDVNHVWCPPKDILCSGLVHGQNLADIVGSK